MWNGATLTALFGSIAAVATAVIAIIHTLQHARSDQAHKDSGSSGPSGHYLP